MQSTLPPRPNAISFTVNMKENNDHIVRKNNLTPQSNYQNIYGVNNDKADLHNDRRPYTLEANVISPKFQGFNPNNNNNNSNSHLNNNSL